MAKPIDILAVEDVEAHFEETSRVYIQAYCKKRGIQPNMMQRVQSQQEARDFIAQSKAAQHELLIIFDTQMESTGGIERLDTYIKSLFTQPPDPWLAQVPIIIFSAFSDQLERDLGGLAARRNFTYIVRKNPRGTENIYEKLQTAITECLDELRQR